ncbi:ABC superfamily ATP binding cassette transporter permease protein [Rhodococcus sp. AW25M09]|nr:ABC superfamily ATP binding cassette transporter permease protein [Rhodococcus sp. AW25M09]
MGDVSLECSKIGESRSYYRCEDRIVDTIGVWPVIGLGLLLAAPPLFAAVTMRQWVSWSAVAMLVCASIAGLINWSSYWGELLSAVPLVVLGSVAAALHKPRPRRVAT